jgi:GTPase SAR1 family protein
MPKTQTTANSVVVHPQFWDTNGQEGYGLRLLRGYYRGVKAALLAFVVRRDETPQ